MTFKHTVVAFPSSQAKDINTMELNKGMESKSFLLKRTHDDRIALGDCRTRISPSDKPVQLHWKRAHPTSSQSDAIILAKCAHDRTSRVQQSDAHLDQHPQKRKKHEEIVAVRSSPFVESQLYMLTHAQYTIQANSDKMRYSFRFSSFSFARHSRPFSSPQ